jgi:hypothetical protein
MKSKKEATAYAAIIVANQVAQIAFATLVFIRKYVLTICLIALSNKD